MHFEKEHLFLGTPRGVLFILWMEETTRLNVCQRRERVLISGLYKKSLGLLFSSPKFASLSCESIIKCYLTFSMLFGAFSFFATSPHWFFVRIFIATNKIAKQLRFCNQMFTIHHRNSNILYHNQTNNIHPLIHTYLFTFFTCRCWKKM